jgi:hypothetical protein
MIDKNYKMLVQQEHKLWQSSITIPQIVVVSRH